MNLRVGFNPSLTSYRTAAAARPRFGSSAASSPQTFKVDLKLLQAVKGKPGSGGNYSFSDRVLSWDIAHHPDFFGEYPEAQFDLSHEDFLKLPATEQDELRQKRSAILRELSSQFMTVYIQPHDSEVFRYAINLETGDAIFLAEGSGKDIQPTGQLAADPGKCLNLVLEDSQRRKAHLADPANFGSISNYHGTAAYNLLFYGKKRP